MTRRTSDPMTTKIEDPYFVEVDANGCGHCGAGRQWTVVGPDGVAIGQSFEDEEIADDIASYMNQAYWVGKGDTEAEIERVKQAFWKEHRCSEPPQ